MAPDILHWFDRAKVSKIIRKTENKCIFEITLLMKLLFFNCHLCFYAFYFIIVVIKQSIMKKILFFLGLIAYFSVNTLAQSDMNFTVIGEVISGKNQEVKISVYEGKTLPSKNQKGNLHKHFVKTVFGANVTGWLDVAYVEVKSVNGKMVEFKILEEKSEVIVNGEKTNHFLKGNTMKFIWPQGL